MHGKDDTYGYNTFVGKPEVERQTAWKKYRLR
jgi:hypothetical protein